MVNRYQPQETWGNPYSQARHYPRPMYRPMMNGPMNPSYPSQQMRRFGQIGPYGQMQPRGGGGLLAKLFGKSTPQMGGGMLGIGPRAAGGVARGSASSGSFLQSLTNPATISGFLNNTQQVLNAFQQITPLVSQYGPIVKNLPTMWRLYRGLKDATSSNDEDKAESSIEIEESSNVIEVEESSEAESARTRTTSSSQDKSTSSNRITQHLKDSNDDEWIEALAAEESSSSDGVRERRSFPRMYI